MPAVGQESRLQSQRMRRQARVRGKEGGKKREDQRQCLWVHEGTRQARRQTKGERLDERERMMEGGRACEWPQEESHPPPPT